MKKLDAPLEPDVARSILHVQRLIAMSNLPHSYRLFGVLPETAEVTRPHDDATNSTERHGDLES
jgi:hypothetical protein